MCFHCFGARTFSKYRTEERVVFGVCSECSVRLLAKGCLGEVTVQIIVQSSLSQLRSQDAL